MRIAVDLSFITPHDHHREGITRYNQFLFDAFLQYNKRNVIELWAYSSSKDDILNCYGFLKDKYPENIFFYCNNKYEKPKKYSRRKLIKLKLKMYFYRMLYNIIKSNYYFDKVNKYQDKIVKLTQNKLQQFILANSKAEVLFSDWIRLEMGHYFKCPKVLMIHDIFPIALRDLFAVSRPNIDASNKTMRDNIIRYVKEGAYIVTSSPYILHEQILKFIPSVDIKKTSVIYYPPIFQEFKTSDILSKKEFCKKFKIQGKYIPYPSQNRPNKNLILLLKALKRLKDRKVDIKLVTTGDISAIDSNKKYIEDNNISDMIMEIGSLSEADLYALYKYATLCVIPTLIEGPGMSQQCLETLKVGGVPVIHTKALGIEDSLNSVGLSFDKADLNWVDVNDDKSLADEIQKVLKNPQLFVERQKGILKAYNMRTWKGVIENYMDVFNKVI